MGMVQLSAAADLILRIGEGDIQLKVTSTSQN